ncbi:MAG: hypothetical protein AAF738_10290, partial [Bacteroidota bacterium]
SDKAAYLKPIQQKARLYRICGRLMKRLPFEQFTEKNKFFLLEKYEEGRLQFLEDTFERFGAIKQLIASYQEQLRKLQQTEQH